MDKIEGAIDTILKERNWKAKLEIGDAWEKAIENGLEGSGLPATITAQLAKLQDIPEFAEEEFEIGNLIDEFDMVGEDDTEAFDYAMSMLYDWADGNSVWVNVIG